MLSSCILIAHRGNIKGPQKELENSPEYLLDALGKGYHAEVDVWLIEDEFFLGHDEPRYRVNSEFLISTSYLLLTLQVGVLSSGFVNSEILTSEA